ncbi:pyridoxamine 5'-phosphate oxidase family protein [Paracoccus sp. p4-l81]|uniref:pyridoxamine 5'-phosphate oxidase family protein n=1 Tax=unclassified Paracoccus (in: a-proteobacteria) TaxID=2688777 RepID=UPI0035B8C6DE
MTGWITDPDDLAALYGTPVGAAMQKVVPRLTPGYARWIAASPLCVLTTIGPNGPDASPRGDDGPVVAILSPERLLLPDWHGNNRIDSLRNILHDNRVALMFMVPGSDNVVRVNGTARISADQALRDGFARNGKLPRSVIEVTITQVMIQCARALMRAGTWAGRPAPDGLPSIGQIMAEIATGDWAAYDRDWPARARQSLW